MHGSMRRREADTVPLAIRPKGPWCLPPTLPTRSLFGFAREGERGERERP